jgi:UDP-glucose:glycoprotein glucosyltransferase
LYAKIGTAKFTSFHRTLSELAKSGKIRYVFRHFDRHAEEVSNGYMESFQNSIKVRVGLSGFGVELAIKNTEYKAVDDSARKDDENEDGEVHGFDFGALR